MSEPVSNSEIEDVLTSIRRLVSENRAQTQKPELSSVPDDVVSDVAEGTSPSALILTPALRVAEPLDQEDHELSDVAEDTATASDPPEDFEATKQGDHAGDTEIGGSNEDGWLADGGEHVDDHLPLDDVSDDSSADEANAAFDAETQSEDNEADEETSQDDDNRDEEDVLQPSGYLPDAELKNADNVTDHLEDHASFPDEANDSLDQEKDGSEAAFETNAAFGEDGDEAEGGAPFDFKSVLGARIVHWRDGDASELPIEPDFPGDSDYAGTEIGTPAWSPDAEPKAVEDDILDALDVELDAEFSEEVQGDVLDDLADAVEDSAVIDEDMLREMVADIVRQELQGALGERITRNVRKLVRREIHRALAAHDLD